MTPHQSVMDCDEGGRSKLFKETYAPMTLLRQPDKEMQGTQRQRPSQTHESHTPKRTHTTIRTHTHTCTEAGINNSALCLFGRKFSGVAQLRLTDKNFVKQFNVNSFNFHKYI